MKVFNSEMVQMSINAIEVLQKNIDKYDIEVGVFDNTPRRKAVSGKKAVIRSLAGGPVRGTKVARVPESSMKVASELEHRFKWLSRPFSQSATNQTKEIITFTKYFVVAIANGEKDGSTLRRISNLIQAIVRNPLTRGDYGRNSAAYAKLKGFNRLMFDTGQFFKSIKARVK